MTQFLIMHQTVAKHDAIGNDIEKMYEILSEHFPCKVYAQNQFNTKVAYLEESELQNWLESKETVVLYHHSVFWQQGEVLLKKCKGKIIFRYHNITPPEFFREYNNFHYEQCLKGREQTIHLAESFPNAYWLCASQYNSQDIAELVCNENINICAPFHKIEQWALQIPDEKVLEEILFHDVTNILFVGRVAPNKGHLMLVKVIQNYCMNFGRKIKLRIIGKFDDGLQPYNDKLIDLIRQYQLEDIIEFIGEINDATLMSYYLGSDIFLCASEHEGFCVPIIEAQFFELPIITLDSSAIPETIGDNQVVLPENIKNFAAAIKVLAGNEQYRKYLRLQGKENFNKRFSQKQLVLKFKNIVQAWCNVKL